MGDDAKLQSASAFVIHVFRRGLSDTVTAHTCHGDRYSRWVHNCLIVQASRRQTRFLLTIPGYFKPERSVWFAVCWLFLVLKQRNLSGF